MHGPQEQHHQGGGAGRDGAGALAEGPPAGGFAQLCHHAPHGLQHLGFTQQHVPDCRPVHHQRLQHGEAHGMGSLMGWPFITGCQCWTSACFCLCFLLPTLCCCHPTPPPPPPPLPHADFFVACILCCKLEALFTRTLTGNSCAALSPASCLPSMCVALLGCVLVDIL